MAAPYTSPKRGSDGIFSARHIVMIALFAACSIACGLIEDRFPLPVPGMRLGLSNVFYLLAASLFGGAEAICVAMLRTAMMFILSGNAYASGCSIGGLVLSIPMTIVLCGTFEREVSLRAVSVAASAVFNLGQLAAASMMSGEPRLMFLYPMLLAAGTAAGWGVGLLAERLDDRLRRILW